MIRRKKTRGCWIFILCIYENAAFIGLFANETRVRNFRKIKEMDGYFYMCEVCRFAPFELIINLHF